MKKGLTEIVFILDRSGSMSGLEKDTIGGYNSLIKKHICRQRYGNNCIVQNFRTDNRHELTYFNI